MIDAEQIRKAILDMAKIKGPYTPFALSEVAKELDLENWEEVMEPVNLVAEVLILQGYLLKEGEYVILSASAGKLN